jgi:hypothetical protein
MRRFAWILLAFLPACANTVDLQVAFPSENAVLISRSAEITLVRLEPGGLGACPALLGTGTTDPFFEENVPVCDLRTHPLPDPGSGAVAVLVRVARRERVGDPRGVRGGRGLPRSRALRGRSLPDRRVQRGCRQLDSAPRDHGLELLRRHLMRSLFLLASTLLVSAIGLVPAVSSAQLQEAEAAYVEVDFETTLRAAQTAIDSGELSPDRARPGLRAARRLGGGAR